MNERDVKRRRVGSTLAALTLLALLVGCAGEGSGNDGASSNASSDGGSGRGGSTARMTIVGDYLYAIAGNDTLQLFDISDPTNPNPQAKVPVRSGLETIFPYENYLLLGAEDGVYILDNADPFQPTLVGEFVHARARDPVVALAGHAYVTLRSIPGGATADQLDVIDLADFTQPRLVDTIPMQGPSGLAIERNGGGRLFVCDSIAGIKVFDTTDPARLLPLDGIRDVDCRDLIVDDGRLYVITDERLLQYDVEQLPARLISELAADTDSPG